MDKKKHLTSKELLDNLKNNDERFKDMKIVKRVLKIPSSIDKRNLIIFDGRNYIRTTDISMKLIDELLDKGYSYVEYDDSFKLEMAYRGILELERRMRNKELE